MPLNLVVEALRSLEDNDSSDSGGGGDDESFHVAEYSVKSSSEGNVSDSDSEPFCFQDKFFSQDLNIIVQGVGLLSYPLSEITIQDLIKVSTKSNSWCCRRQAKPNKCRAEHDVRVICPCKFSVSMKQPAWFELLDRIRSGLNVNDNCIIESHLHGILVCGPGKVFKNFRDSEKILDVVATLVVVLPSAGEGGDLFIEHNKMKRVFFSSKNPEILKCIAFYGYCRHEVKKMTKGVWVALTYDIVISSKIITKIIGVDSLLLLNTAVARYFKSINFITGKYSKRLVYVLNDNYPKYRLNWHMLKGIDYVRAQALLAVAKKQDRIPYLALIDYKETSKKMSESEYGDTVIDSSAELIYWVDKHSRKICKSKFFSEVFCEELCYTEEMDSGAPYKLEETIIENFPSYYDFYFRRACVVLYSNKWVCFADYTDAVHEIYRNTTKAGMENHVLEEIDKAGINFLQSKFCTNSSISDMLFQIVIYIKNREKAVLILSRLPQQLLKLDNLAILLKLDRQYDLDTWTQITDNWKKKSISLSVYDAIKLINKLKNTVKNKVIFEFVLDRYVDAFVSHDSDLLYKYGKISSKKILKVSSLIRICIEFKNKYAENKLINHLMESFPAVSQSELYFSLRMYLSSKQFSSYKYWRDNILNLIEKQLLKFKDEYDWSCSVNSPCRCPYCSSVKDFFESKSARIILLPIANDIDRAHALKFVEELKKDLPITFKILDEKTKNPKIFIEKKPKLINDRKTFVRRLIMCKERLEGIEVPSKRRKYK